MSGLIPPLVNSDKTTFESAQALSSQVSNLKLLRKKLKHSEDAWMKPMERYLRDGTKNEVLALFEMLAHTSEAFGATWDEFDLDGVCSGYV